MSGCRGLPPSAPTWLQACRLDFQGIVTSKAAANRASPSCLHGNVVPYQCHLHPAKNMVHRTKPSRLHGNIVPYGHHLHPSKNMVAQRPRHKGSFPLIWTSNHDSPATLNLGSVEGAAADLIL